ncbi:hypothetical protein GXP67_20560 [Rhodocytophaga rosea]|uniref:Uncharacterized protein n=1 Tax=Rhodocytophaga rosea TaxID=2704465 RepID=A0A6C0GMK9_9BACT|nr:hypothetical protein [Rhodocytophaga rosea]QHT68870.1 hypothetical protein GXP67_20560 [Rhodocytophaga rosea]
MGLDIRVVADIPSDLFYTDEYFDKHLKEFSLSRTFCNLYFTYQNYLDNSEFIQISKIIGVDFTPLLKMASYPSPEYIEAMLEIEAKTEEEKTQLLKNFEREKLESKQSIADIKVLLRQLHQKLERIENLQDLIKYNEYHKERFYRYFEDFVIDVGDGYIGNNFGQDVRNFIKILEYSEKQGAQNVYFDFG